MQKAKRIGRIAERLGRGLGFLLILAGADGALADSSGPVPAGLLPAAIGGNDVARSGGRDMRTAAGGAASARFSMARDDVVDSDDASDPGAAPSTSMPTTRTPYAGIHLDATAVATARLVARLVQRFDVLAPRGLIDGASTLAGADPGSGAAWGATTGATWGAATDGRSMTTGLRAASLILGGESRRVPMGLAPTSDRRVDDAFMVWVPSTRLALSGGYAWLRRAAEGGRRRGACFSLQLTY